MTEQLGRKNYVLPKAFRRTAVSPEDRQRVFLCKPNKAFKIFLLLTLTAHRSVRSALLTSVDNAKGKKQEKGNK